MCQRNQRLTKKMPKRPSTSMITQAKKIKTKTYKRKAQYARPVRPLSFSNSGFPKEMRITHKYCDTFTITNALGAIGSYVFAANGLYDPNVTTAGHQPQYFDVCGGLYNHYTVVASRFILKIQNSGAAPVNVAVYIEDDAAVGAASVFQAAEYSTGKFATLGLPSSGNNNALIKHGWNAVANFGEAPEANDQLQGTITSNPSERSYYTIVTQGAGSVSPASTTECLVTIFYDTIWSELTAPGAN